MATARTHTAPHIGATHNGPFETCSQYPCQPSRQATAFLRENDPLTPVETVAWNVVKERAWTLWHAKDRDLGIVLVLSRAGLLRDIEHEQRTARAGTYWAGVAATHRAADGTALTRHGQLAEQAAERLDRGDDPREVAAWLREMTAAISKQRETARASSPAEPSEAANPA
jgi:hypothetical protein